MDLSYTDAEYKNLIDDCMTNGDPITTRNSNVLRVVGHKVTFKTTPLVTLRKCAWKNALREWEWFMSGSSNIKDLHPSVHGWWKEWADENGEVKYNYSAQFRHQYGCDREYAPVNYISQQELVHCDQIEEFISDLKQHPNSRRIILSTWNSAEMRMPDCPITNCHNTLTQAFVTNGKLTLLTYQRSVDVICGLPHNWIQMWAFQMWLCNRANLKMDKLIWIGGDCHVYEQHFALAAKMLSTEPKDSPQLVYNPTSDSFKADDFSLDREYQPSLTDRAEMVV